MELNDSTLTQFVSLKGNIGFEAIAPNLALELPAPRALAGSSKVGCVSQRQNQLLVHPFGQSSDY